MTSVRKFEAGSVAVVLGTRPEIIKLAELIRLLGPAARVVYTGQHYDPRLGPAFFVELGLTAPDVLLSVGGATRGHQIGEAIRLLDEQFHLRPPAAVVVQGDTNATVSGAMAANASGVPVVHVEAGLRSFDRAMPEEHNRVVADHLADYCCAPTEVNRHNLLAERIGEERIAVTGNTLVETLQRLVPSASDRAALTSQLDVHPNRFVLATFHRPENVDDPRRLETILRQLVDLPFPVILPVHPRTAARVHEFDLSDLLGKVGATDPMGYASFLGLATECAFMVSDSGGLQEESTILKRPLLVVRNSTERPECLTTFAQLVRPGPEIGTIADAWAADLPSLHRRLMDAPSPYGDGRASQRCLDALRHVVMP